MSYIMGMSNKSLQISMIMIMIYILDKSRDYDNYINWCDKDDDGDDDNDDDIGGVGWV